MINKIAFAVLLAGVAGFFSGNAANAASAPAAFYQFCSQNPSQCAATGKRGPVQMNSQRWSQLRSINSGVNRSIRETADSSRGSADRWNVLASGGQGDCEDFALTKRMKLIQAGWPSSALLMTVVRTRAGDGHAVLTVRTSEGDYILDNLTSSIRTPQASGHYFYTRQSESDPRSWVSISANGGGSKLKTAGVNKRQRRHVVRQIDFDPYR